MKAHLVGLARVLATANKILLGWVFPRIWGFPGETCVFMCLWLLLVIFLYIFLSVIIYVME